MGYLETVGLGCDDFVYASDTGRSIRRTSTGGLSCDDVAGDPADGGLPEAISIRDMAVDPSDSDVVYLAAAGAGGGLFKTENVKTGVLTGPPPAPLAVRWDNITPIDSVGGQITTMFRTVGVDPINTNVVYAGGQHGLFRSNNGGRSWVHVGAERGVPMTEVT